VSYAQLTNRRLDGTLALAIAHRFGHGLRRSPKRRKQTRCATHPRPISWQA
jgi:hypothetical protein